MALWLYWSTRGYLEEGQRWMERALAGGTLSITGRARALLTLGTMLHPRGRVAEAAAALDEAVADLREVGDADTLCQALVNRALVAVWEGRTARAEALLAEALEGFRARGEAWGIGSVLALRADAVWSQRDAAQALALLTGSEAILRQVGTSWHLAIALNGRGLVAYTQGDGRGAERAFAEAARLFGDVRESWALVQCLVGLAATAAIRRDGRRAALLCGAVEALRERVGVAVRPAYQPLYEHAIQGARELLSGTAFALAWQEGRELLPEEVVAVATEGLG